MVQSTRVPPPALSTVVVPSHECCLQVIEIATGPLAKPISPPTACPLQRPDPDRFEPARRIGSPVLRRVTAGVSSMALPVSSSEVSLIDQLAANGDINFWDQAISQAATLDPFFRRITVLVQRGSNRSSELVFDLPSELFFGEKRRLLLRYLTASVYNTVVCEGAENLIVFFPEDQAEEKYLAAALDEELRQRYERAHIYGNFGDPIRVFDSTRFSVTYTKELKPKIVFDANDVDGKWSVGVDVGGTAIKVVVLQGTTVMQSWEEAVERSRGGAVLKDQILEQITRAVRWVKRASVDDVTVEAVGLTFPSPIKYNPDGSFEVVRLTNYERYWAEARKGTGDFAEDYRALNAIIKDINDMGIGHVGVLNDADAFGFHEMFDRKRRTGQNSEQGVKVVLPIGTGPGYVKIADGQIESIPNQGGHMVLDLSETASSDPGCGVKGCYGAFVPGSAFAHRARQFNIGLSGNDSFVPADLGGALSLLNDMALRIASEAVQTYKITGANEIILAGGISAGPTGLELVQKANAFLVQQFPEFCRCVKITLSQQENIVFGGALGAAEYAMAQKRTAQVGTESPWKISYNIPTVQVGKHIIDDFFGVLADSRSKACVFMSRELDVWLTRHKAYSWLMKAKRAHRVLYIEDFPTIDALAAALKARKTDMIVPMGAGTVTDWGKYVGQMLRLERENGFDVVCIPTALSGNGMFTEKAIFYKTAGARRVRQSETCLPPSKVLVDLALLRDLMPFQSKTGITAERANRAGAGDLLSICPALLDWDLALEAGAERQDEVIYETAKRILAFTESFAEDIGALTDIGLMALTEALAEASLLNMRFGTSRPKDGAEHLVADNIDQRLPEDYATLHGEQVALAALIMGYLHSSSYDTRAVTRIRKLAKALRLPLNPDVIGMNREVIIHALQTVVARNDKFTYFNAYDRVITPAIAERAFEVLFGNRTEELIEFMLETSRYMSNSVLAMFEHITNEVVPNLDAAKTRELIDLLLETRERHGRVIISAAGRIGEVAVFFREKLRALGFIVDDLREITPEFLVGENDLVLTFSGSGATASVLGNLANVDQMHHDGKLHRRIFSITATPDAPAWRMGVGYHSVLEIKGRSKMDFQDVLAVSSAQGKNGDSGQNTSQQATRRKGEGFKYLPLSSTFEYSALLFLEGVVEALTRDDDNLDEEQTISVVKRVIEETPAAIRGDLTRRLQDNEKVTADFVEELLTAVQRLPDGRFSNPRRVYLFGLGQNNYVIRLFARRIQNIGLEVYVPGPRDIISAARKGDICVFVSNSGARGSMITKIEQAIEIGCYNIVITADPEAALAKKGQMVIPICGMTTAAHTADIMANDEKSHHERKLKRMFEIAAMFYLEGVSVALMRRLGLESRDLLHVAKEWE